MTTGRQPDDTPRNARPILIFGAPRSGTSLLSRLLNAHSRIAIPFESHLFNQWMERAQSYGDLSSTDAQRRLVGDIIAFGVVRDWTPLPDAKAVLAHVQGPGFGAVARAFMDWAAEIEDKQRWGEKTPHHTLLHADVLREWADALVVIIERDPRDVALSWKRARFGGNHVLPFARAWVKYVEACEAVRESLPPSRVFDLRYESLVTAPEDTLQELMVFLGENFEIGQLSFHQSGHVWKTDSRNQRKLQTPISDQSIGQWSIGLAPREGRLIETIAGDAMERRGYASSPGTGTTTTAELSFAKWVEFPAQRLLGLAKNARGFVYIGRDVAWRLRDLGTRRLMRP